MSDDTTQDPPSEAPDQGEAVPKRVRLMRKIKKTRKVRLRRRAEDEPDEEEVSEAPEPTEEGDEVLIDEEFEGELDPENPAEGLRNMVGSIVEAVLPDLVKRAVASGSETLSEEAMREMIDDIPMPGEVAEGIGGLAGGVRAEFYKILTKEIQRFLSTINISGELQKILTSMTFEIRTEIRFKATEKGLKPSVKNKVRVKK